MKSEEGPWKITTTTTTKTKMLFYLLKREVFKYLGLFDILSWIKIAIK